MTAPKAIDEVTHGTIEPLHEECDGFDAALSETGGGFGETFMTAASPGIVCAAMLDDHYASDDDYVAAVAEALRPEYEYIVSRGYVLQLDCPDLAMERHVVFADRPLADFQAYVRRNIAAINRAIAGLPAERIRMHVCWGNYEGPHHLDVPLEDVLPLYYEANVGALLLPFANPRHQHEWRVLQKFPLADDQIIVAGVIDDLTGFVEHPEVVADRIENVARAIGDPTRVMAGTDCGFDTSAGMGRVTEDVVWAKLKAMADGAKIASERLGMA
jgi:5-methyltetrahydropteroyltriglutamate--homocysteine methyltransferase